MSKPSKKYLAEMEEIDRQIAELSRQQEQEANEKINNKYPNFEGVTYTEAPRLEMIFNTIKPILIRI